MCVIATDCLQWLIAYLDVLIGIHCICVFVCLYKRRAEMKTQFRLWTHWMKFYMRCYHICCHFVVNHFISMTLILVLARSFMFVAFVNMSLTERTYFVWKCFNVYFIHFMLDSLRLYEKVRKKPANNLILESICMRVLVLLQFVIQLINNFKTKDNVSSWKKNNQLIIGIHW